MVPFRVNGWIESADAETLTLLRQGVSHGWECPPELYTGCGFGTERRPSRTLRWMVALPRARNGDLQTDHLHGLCVRRQHGRIVSQVALKLGAGRVPCGPLEFGAMSPAGQGLEVVRGPAPQRSADKRRSRRYTPAARHTLTSPRLPWLV